MLKKEDLVEVKGIVDAITYKNRENGYTVLRLKVGGEMLIVTGMLPYVNDGETIIAYGNYTVHPKYGRQFKCEACETTVPETQAQILKYLSSGAIKGIGPTTAVKLVEYFKEDTLDIIENCPERLTAIKGISHDKAISISEQYKQQFGLRDIMMALSRFKISPTEATAIFKTLGSESVDILKTNPYALCGDGINFPFERADEIADAYGLALNSEYRISAGITFVLKANLSNGHTCLPITKLVAVTAKMLSLKENDVLQTLNNMIDRLQLFSFNISDSDFVFLPDYAEAEEYIAGKITAMLKNNIRLSDISRHELNFVQNRLNIEFDDVQIQAVNTAMHNNLFILTGGPGTGKTTTLNGIIEIFDNRQLSIALAAPTGRAAKRMTELTGREASTLHRLLEVEWGDADEPYFAKNKKHQLDYDVVIIDELSMVDAKLFRAFLEAVKISTRIILVGDSDQLPSVGAGNVLNDMLASRLIPFVKLEKIFRQASESAIVTFAHDIIAGEMPPIFEKKDDFYFIRRSDAHTVATTVSELYCERLPKAYGYIPINDIQVLCPSKKMECGTVNINNILQNAVNPLKENMAELHYKGTSFRVGDKVMNIKNNYDILWESDNGESGSGIFNGDIGFIQELDIVNRTIRVRYDDKCATYYDEDLGLLELAYAVTVHKSQGCEFNCVLLPLFDASVLLRYRNLLYTAITRAKKLLIIIGSADVFSQMVLNDKKTLRYTGLKFFLEQNSL